MLTSHETPAIALGQCMIMNPYVHQAGRINSVLFIVHEHHICRSKNIIPPQTVLVRLVKPTVPARYVALPRNGRENQCLVGTR